MTAATGAAPEILVVEDEPELRSLIVELLKKSGFRVREAADGIGAYEILQAHPPQLVLCDITMPRMTGYQLLEKVRETLPDVEDIPFMFLTALAGRDDILKGLDLGADDYIIKPIDFDLLERKVRGKLREMQRMLDKRERALVKLYMALAPDPPPGAGVEPRPKESEPGSPMHATPEQASEERVRSACTRIAERNGGQLVAGCMQVIGLDRLRASCGTRWDSVRAGVMDLARQEASRHLGPGDVLSQSACGDLLICFAELSQAAAEEKAQAIIDEITWRIHDQDELVPAPDLRMQVAKLDVGESELQDRCDLTVLLTARLKSISEASHKDAAATLKEIAEHGRLSFPPVRAGKGRLAPFRLSAFDAETGRKARRLVMGSGDQAGIRAQIDAVMLTRIAEWFVESGPSENVGVCSAVDYGTIADDALFERYLSICQRCPPDLHDLLILQIVGGPRAFSLPADRLSALKSFSRLIAVELAEPRVLADDIARMRASIIAFDCNRQRRTLAGERMVLRSFADQVHKAGAKLLALCAKPDDRDMLRQIGVDFICEQA